MNLATAFPRWPNLGRFLITRGRKSPSTAPRVKERQHRLPRHATLRLPDHEATIQVVSGCVWITCDGCATDWVLEAGQVFSQAMCGPVLVHALQDAEFVLAWGRAGNQND